MDANFITDSWYAGFAPSSFVPFSQSQIQVNQRYKQVPAKHLTSQAFYMYQRYLLQKAMSVFKWDLPKSWDKNFLLFNLYCRGYVAQFEHSEYGNIILNCGFQGNDIYYRPTTALINSHAFPDTITKTIVKEWDKNIKADTACIIWHLTPDYLGIMDMVNYYAGLMAAVAGAIDANSYNTRVAYLFLARNKQVAETMKDMYDRISEGNPAVFIDKSLFDEDGKPLYEMLGENVKETYIIDKLLLDLSKIDDMFSTEIGIPNANTEKRERLIADEVNANNFETRSKCELWLDELAKCEELSRKVFGEENTPKVTWRNELIEGGAEDERKAFDIGLIQGRSDNI